MSAALSIDFDFFPWNGAEQELDAFSPVTGAPTRTSGTSMFDWGHSESRAVELAEWMWLNLWVGIAAWGLDPEQTAAIRPERGCTPVDRFVDELARRYRLDPAPLWIADSHTYGYPTMQNLAADTGDPVDYLISFDAHHDLGYDRGAIADQRKRGLVSCESWLYHALRRGYVERATVVYPDWRGLQEWKGVSSQPWLRRLRGRIEALTWSQWLAAAAESGEEVEVVFACRSSAWVPPWEDAEFAALVDRLTGFSGLPLCWDCITEGGESKVGDQNACRPRVWSRAAADATLAQWRAAGTAAPPVRRATPTRR